CGAKVAERMGGKLTVSVILLAQVGAVAVATVYRQPAAAWTLTTVLGCALGSTASVFPVYLAGMVGSQRAGILFPRLIIFYGIAGLLAPVAFAFVQLHFGYGGALPLLLVVTLSALIVQFRAPAEEPEAGRTG